MSILNPLADLVAWVIIHLHTGLGALFGPNTGLAWGLSIAILVILIRLCLVPLFVKQIHAQRKMAQHAPHLAELRKKYKNDKQRLNEETMKFYKENGVNPLAGCLPMIPQMIIFFSLFYVLRAIAEWKPGVAPKYGMTVALMKSAQKAKIFGIHLGDKLLFPHTPGMGLWPSIIAAVTIAISASTTFMTVRQTAKRGLMQTNVDPDNPMAQSQKYMQYIVPFFSLTGLYWQYGLVLYWVTTNVWTLGQQYIMFRNWTPESTAAAGATAAATAAAAPARTAPRTGTASKTATARTTAPRTTATRTTAGSSRPASGTAKTSSASTVKTSAGSTARPAPAAKPGASGAAKTAAGAQNGSANGRSSSASRPKPAPARPSTARTSPAPQSTAPATKTASRPEGTEKRGLLRLGRSKPEPAPEPEAPATKVVRQQPVRQAKSKRSGKR